MEKKHFKAIVENGYQILQTPGGERINYVTETSIKQDIEKIGTCVFSAIVNYQSSSDLKTLKYNPETKKLSSPNGEVLEVEILNFNPETITRAGSVKVRCTVVFPYDTGHKNFVPDDLKMIV